MKNKVEDLRNHLFATIEALMDEGNPMELDRARTIAQVATVIVESAKAETQHLRLAKEHDYEATGTVGTGFIPLQPRQALIPKRLANGHDAAGGIGRA